MKSIASLLSQAIRNVKLSDAHDGKGTGIEHRVADAHHDVIENGCNETQKHESNCKCDHDYWCLKMNDYVLKYALLLQR